MRTHDIQEEEGDVVLGLYKAVYLGTVPMNKPADVPVNNFAVSLCFKQCEQLNQIPRKVYVGVSSRQVSTWGRKTHNVLQKTPLEHVVYSGLLQKDHTKFAYVSEDPDIRITLCHMFTIKDRARTLPATIAKAFKVLQEQAEAGEHDAEKRVAEVKVKPLSSKKAKAASTGTSLEAPSGEKQQDEEQQDDGGSAFVSTSAASSGAEKESALQRLKRRSLNLLSRQKGEADIQGSAPKASASTRSAAKRSQSTAVDEGSTAREHQDQGEGRGSKSPGVEDGERSMGTFVAKFIGACHVRSSKGPEPIDMTLKELGAVDTKGDKRARKKQQRGASRRLAGDGVLVSVTNEAIRTIDRLSNRVLHNAFIRNVTYTTAGILDKRRDFFAFIEHDARRDDNKCHLFEVQNGMGENMCKVVSKAFKAFSPEVAAAASFDVAKGKTASTREAGTTGGGTSSTAAPPGTASATRGSGGGSAAGAEGAGETSTGLTLPEQLQELQLNRDTIIALKVLGSGVYGKVYLADQRLKSGENVQRAVKLLRGKSTAREQKMFLREVQTMNQLRNEHLVSVVGLNVTQLPWLCVLEFMQYGDLGGVLDAISAKNIALFDTEKLHLGLQVVRGMKYITSQRFVHMDLAARNCLLHTNNTVKIGDFGLTRPYDEGKDYWLMRETLKLAVKWIPPDALKTKRFGEPTDVWAFGVCLWEIFSMGATPFKELPVPEVPARVRKGLRLPQPEGCSDGIYNIMRKCWDADPCNRFTFAQLEVELSQGLAVAKRQFPPARDVGELVNQKLSADVRRLSVSAAARGRTATASRTPKLASIKSQDEDANTSATTEQKQQQEHEEQRDEGREPGADAAKKAPGTGGAGASGSFSSSDRSRIRLRSVSRAAMRKTAAAAAAATTGAGASREGDEAKEDEDSADKEDRAQTEEQRGDEEGGGAVVTMEGELVPEDAPVGDDEILPDDDHVPTFAPVAMSEGSGDEEDDDDDDDGNDGGNADDEASASKAEEERKVGDDAKGDGAEGEKPSQEQADVAGGEDEPAAGLEQAGDSSKDNEAEKEEQGQEGQVQLEGDQQHGATEQASAEDTAGEAEVSSAVEPSPANTGDAGDSTDKGDEAAKEVQPTKLKKKEGEGEAEAVGSDGLTAKQRERYRRLGLLKEEGEDEAQQQEHSRIYQALNPQPLFKEQTREAREVRVRDRTYNRGGVGNGDGAGDDGEDEEAGDVLAPLSGHGGPSESGDDGFPGMTRHTSFMNAYNDAVVDGDDDDDDEDDGGGDEEDFDGDPSSLPDFGELEDYFRAQREKRAKEQEERRRRLQEEFSRQKQEEDAAREYVLMKISKTKAQENEEKEKKLKETMEESMERLKDLQFSFTFDSTHV